MNAEELFVELEKQDYDIEEKTEKFANAVSYTIFTEKKYQLGLDMAQRMKDEVVAWSKEQGYTFWELEDLAIKSQKTVPLIHWFYQLCLLRSFWSLEDFIFYMEQDRPQGKRFYLPRMNPLHTLIGDFEDLFNRKIKFLGVSLPPRVGKSTLALMGVAWLLMKRPNSHSAMGGHSGILTNGFYEEMLNFMTSSEYRFAQMYQFWNKGREMIQDKSAEYTKINLDMPDRMGTLTCRGIDGTWTGAIDISWDGVLYVDDLVRDRTHALSPTRMESTWQDYLNKMFDRINPYCPKGSIDEKEIYLEQNLFPEPPQLMIGTLWNVFDPLYRYEQKYKDDPLYRFRKIPALDENEKSNFAYIPTEFFLKQKEILSEADFSAKFQQSPFVREGILFAKSELNYFDGNVPEVKHRIIAILDPAVGGGDNLSMPILWVDNKRKFVIDWIYDKRTKAFTIPKIIKKIMFHNIGELYYERNGIGRAFEDSIKEELKKNNYFGCLIKHFNAPELMDKNTKILNYSDSIKAELYFIDEMATGTYKRSEEYGSAMWDLCTYTTQGKNKTDDAPDSLAQTMRVLEKQSNGAIKIIKNPFGGL